jgi:hypothetical protein
MENVKSGNPLLAAPAVAVDAAVEPLLRPLLRRPRIEGHQKSVNKITPPLVT